MCFTIARPRPVPPLRATAIRLVETFEHARLLVRLDADAGVSHADRRRRPSAASARHRDRASAFGELDRVRDEVAERALQPFGVADDRQRRHGRFRRAASGRRARPAARSAAPSSVTRRRASSCEKCIGAAPDSMRDSSSSSSTSCVIRSVSRWMCPRNSCAAGSVLDRAFLQRFGRGADAGERRAQLVRDVADEVAPHAFEPPHLSEVVEDRQRRPRPASRSAPPSPAASAAPARTPRRARCARRAAAATTRSFRSWSRTISMNGRPTATLPSAARKQCARRVVQIHDDAVAYRRRRSRRCSRSAAPRAARAPASASRRSRSTFAPPRH